MDSPDHAALLVWYRDLIALRRSEPDLTDPRPDRMSVAVDDASATVDLRRGSIRVLVNFGATDHEFEFEQPMTVVLATPNITAEGRTIRVPADGVAIVGP